MPVLWSPEMKHQHQPPAQDLEKRLRFLDEYKRIGGGADEISDVDGDEREEAETEAEDRSPSSRFFLTK
jgi:hypothetical protein